MTSYSYMNKRDRDIIKQITYTIGNNKCKIRNLERRVVRDDSALEKRTILETKNVILKHMRERIKNKYEFVNKGFRRNNWRLNQRRV